MQMVPCLQDAAEWEALYNASQKLKVMLELAGAEDVAESEDGQCSEAPPDLQLSSYIPDIQEALRQHLPSAVGFQELVDMYERSLISDARHLQATFESGWTECKGVDVAVMQGRQALIRLHTVAFKEAAAYRKEVILARLRGQQDMQTDSVGEKGCEWTDETRALMERVYQQHPKLGAHEKKVLSEVSGLSLRQISIWFANQRQRRGWPIQLEESIIEEPEEVKDVQQHSTPVKSSSSLSASTSSTTSSIERSPTPLTPFSASSACPSLSSSTSSRSSSDSYSCSPTRASFNHGANVEVIQNQPPTFDFSQPQAVPTPSFDIDQLIRQLTPPQPARNEETPSFTPLTTFNPTLPDEKATNGPFTFKAEEGDAQMSSGDSTPPLSLSSHEQLQWLPINVQSLYPQTETTLSQNHALEDETPQAVQFTFAPLQLDTSQYLQQSPSRNVDLSSLVNDLDTDSFWKSFGSSNGIPQMPSATTAAEQSSMDTVSIAQPEVNWSEVFLKDMETWGKPPQQAPLQFQF